MKFRNFHTRTDARCLPEDRQILDLAVSPFKEYPRFPQVVLPKPASLTAGLTELLKNRASAQEFNADEELSIETLSTILDAGAGLNSSDDTLRRHHPSGGALYPLEYYVFPYRVESLQKHCYHYAPRTHTLEELISCPPLPDPSDIWFQPLPNASPAVVILVTSLWSRNFPKYGEFAYRLALFEAGHSVQNMLLAATSLSIKARPIAGIETDKVVRLLDLAHSAEDPLYLLVLSQ